MAGHFAGPMGSPWCWDRPAFRGRWSSQATARERPGPTLGGEGPLGVQLPGDRAEGGPGQDLGRHPSDGLGLGLDQGHPVGAVPEGPEPAHPSAVGGRLEPGTLGPVGVMLGLEAGVGAELAGHQSARGRGQVQGSGLDRLGRDLPRLADLDVFLQLDRGAVQPVGVPAEDGVGDPGPQVGQQASVAGPRLAPSRRTRRCRCRSARPRPSQDDRPGLGSRLLAARRRALRLVSVLTDPDVDGGPDAPSSLLLASC